VLCHFQWVVRQASRITSAVSFAVVFFLSLITLATRRLSMLSAACLGGEGGSVNVLLKMVKNIAVSLTHSLSPRVCLSNQSLSLALIHINASIGEARHKILRKPSRRMSADAQYKLCMTRINNLRKKGFSGFLSCLIEKCYFFHFSRMAAQY
jgi:hypothetical protein